ncbi:Zinc-finger associated domain (zf-AD) [Popillia japonica]|uniref:Zinc-finger associated domain (Zf-AD) n=1 Tax=Popillia japonica TaxID=7064 RepID=A0AAW1KG85_POPJA
MFPDKAEKLISEILMECFPIKIQKDDGLPTHICNFCLEKLNFTHNFKTVVLESDTKLNNFYRKKVFLPEYKESIFVKEEDSLIKTETEGDNVNRLELEEENVSGIDLLSVADELRQSQEESQTDEANEPKVEDRFNDKQDNSDSNDFVDTSFENFVSSSEESSSSDGEYSSDSKEGVTKIAGRRKKIDKRKLNNPNEKQALMLGNPDVERIINSKMSRTEKNHAKVFCKLCNRHFNFRYYVSVHCFVHTGNLKYKCEHCDKYFPKSFFLKQHMNTHAVKQFACEECGKMYATLGLLQGHKVTHSDAKPHVCTVCNKAFKWRNTYNKHCLIHNESNRKNYICEQCGKSYSEHSSLLKHRKTHNPHKNFICSVCSKGFNSKSLLNTHLRRHSDRKKHACTECGKEFAEKSVLVSHILIHTGEKPFQSGVPRDSVSGPIRLRMKSFGRDGAIVAAAREELM